MNPKPKLHIASYEVDLQEKTVVFQLKEHEGERIGEAVFKGVCGHQFSNVLCGNIVVSIRECSPEELREKYTQELEEYQQCGLPFNAYKPKEFSSSIERRSIKPMVITGQYGFSGWVLCESARVNLGGTEISYP